MYLFNPAMILPQYGVSLEHGRALARELWCTHEVSTIVFVRPGPDSPSRVPVKTVLSTHFGRYDSTECFIEAFSLGFDLGTDRHPVCDFRPVGRPWHPSFLYSDLVTIIELA